MNLKKEIKTIKGDTCPMSYPGTSDFERIKKEKGLEVIKMSDLPTETVGNMIINAIANYEVKNKKEVFELNALAQLFLNESNGEIKLSQRQVDFLSNDILPQATLRKEMVTLPTGETKEETRGLYSGWSIVQVYAELGITE